MNFGCKCGYRFHDSSDNLSYKAYIISDEDWDEFAGLLENAEKPHTEELDSFGKIFDLTNRCIYQCPACGRLFLEDASGRLTMFTPGDTAEPEPDVNRQMLISAHGANWHGILFGSWYDPKPAWHPHPGFIYVQMNDETAPAQQFDDFAETEQAFHIMFEKLRAEDSIHYAAFHVYEQVGSRCLFSWNREKRD